MRQAKQRRASIGLVGFILASLLAVTSVPFLAGQAMAGDCFPDVYYNFMFKPIAQEAYQGGDARLQGMSDYLAAKGEDPHDKGGSGCMCGVNNGRWDQMLLNRSNGGGCRGPISWSRARTSWAASA